ncbi:Serpin B13 [Cricetulus griseus]|uniref:Serpin B13 n=1 Tax=Cricetulus griseus TaxID=10029 RepID=G3HD40_CRIGR|nr:Serpin B13 [Cricetulus griseus]
MHLFAEATTKFTLELYWQLRETEKNIFCSPTSIMAALAMLELGAKGNTKQQIEKVLQFNGATKKTTEKSTDCHDEKSESVHHQFQQLMTQVNKPNDAYDLKSANSIYGAKDFPFLQNSSKPVQMMKQRSNFNINLLEDVQAKIVEIPYKGKELSMFILLPDEIDGLKKLEDKLTADKLIEWASPQNMYKVELYLSLPRFKVEEKYDLTAPLEHMGMVDAFNPQKADFSGMSGSQGLSVTKVLHKSFVEVTEEGTEAAAATGVEVSLTSALRNEVITCDHPYLFFIKHRKFNTIFFLGRMVCP